MATIDNQGMLVDRRIQARRFPGIEHGTLTQVHALVVHQTDSSSEQATFNGYAKGGNGAHFLIGKSGTIYQTASVSAVCYHVGRLLKSKCLEISGKACSDKAAVALLTLGWAARIAAVDQHERAKAYPDRYPFNRDSLGIELVGKSLDKQNYEPVTAAQNLSLQWLVSELSTVLQLGSADVYRHPDVSFKEPGEAASAQWR